MEGEEEEEKAEASINVYFSLLLAWGGEELCLKLFDLTSTSLFSLEDLALLS